MRTQKKFLVYAVVILIGFSFFINSHAKPKSLPLTRTSPCSISTLPIDVVYTWVNGSDPVFLKQLAKQDTKRSDTAEDTAQSRFQDFNQLLYSLRSVELYAPWVNRVFIVTNGQVPYWLNETHATIVTHDKIFDDPSHLPTFNSPAIEAHFHSIPDLAENFIYFNDDISLTGPMCPSDFVSADAGFTVRSSGKQYSFLKDNFFPPAKCSSLCLGKRGNGVCDQTCNTVNCLYDGNECGDQLPPSDGRPSWFGAVDFTLAMLTERLGRFSPLDIQHMPQMMNKRILANLNKYFGQYYNETSSHHTRQRNEVQTQIAYNNWLVAAPASSNVNVDKQLYQSTLVDVVDWRYVGYGAGTVDDAQEQLRITLRDIAQIKLLCVNDLINYSLEYESEQKMFIVQNFYEKLFSNKSKYERS